MAAQLDGPLGAATAVWLQQHLASCAACRTLRAGLRADARRLAADPAVVLPEEHLAAILAALPGQGAGSRPLAARGRQPAAGRRQALARYAAAALLLVAFAGLLAARLNRGSPAIELAAIEPRAETARGLARAAAPEAAAEPPVRDPAVAAQPADRSARPADSGASVPEAAAERPDSDPRAAGQPAPLAPPVAAPAPDSAGAAQGARGDSGAALPSAAPAGAAEAAPMADAVDQQAAEGDAGLAGAPRSPAGEPGDPARGELPPENESAAEPTPEHPPGAERELGLESASQASTAAGEPEAAQEAAQDAVLDSVEDAVQVALQDAVQLGGQDGLPAAADFEAALAAGAPPQAGEPLEPPPGSDAEQPRGPAPGPAIALAGGTPFLRRNPAPARPAPVSLVREPGGWRLSTQGDAREVVPALLDLLADREPQVRELAEARLLAVAEGFGDWPLGPSSSADWWSSLDGGRARGIRGQPVRVLPDEAGWRSWWELRSSLLGAATH